MLAGREAASSADTSLQAPGLATPVPDSIDAELSLLAYQGRSKTLVSARLFARPGQCGKLDLYGFPGMLGGSFQWKQAAWELAIYDPPRYLQGEGKRVPLPLPGEMKAPYDVLFAPLWGALFPWPPGTPLTAESGSGRHLAGRGEGGLWSAHLSAASGLPDTVWDRSQGWRITYERWKKQGERPYPGVIKCFQRDQLWLEIEVRTLRDNPEWGRSPFVLRKPAGT